MTETRQSPPAITARDEKLRAIATVFGEAVANRISPGAGTSQAPGPDTDRLAWQTNRLIRHLRDRTDLDGPRGASLTPDADRPRPGPATPPAPLHRPRRGPMPVLVAGEDLAAEHPAVIAHLLKGESQQIRVSVLRALPGQVARAVMRRLHMG